MTDKLKQAIERSGLTVYAVAKATGLQTDSLYRFLDGRTSLRLDLADRVAALFKLELRETAKGKGKKGTHNGKRS